MSGPHAVPPLDIAALRRRLGQGPLVPGRVAPDHGLAYWRSLKELAETPEFLASLADAFPELGEAAANAPDRRRFLQLMAASMALAGMAGCGPEPLPRKLVPYVQQPPGMVPGKERYFATATSLDGYGTGVMLAHQMGRPIKVEGNPDHPASLGATSAIGQATILGLYDPYRAQAVMREGQIDAWQSFVTAVADRRRALAAGHGAGLRLLTGTVTSPTLNAQIAALQQQFPAMRWHQWEPLHRDGVREGARLAYGRYVDAVFAPGNADVIVAIESDLIDAAPGHLRYAREFAGRRRAAEIKGAMSRVYALESTPTLIGAKADHRLMAGPAEIAAALRAIAAGVGAGPQDWAPAASPHADRLAAIVKDLKAHHGRVLLHAGREQPAETHALIHAIHATLGAEGRTVRLIEPVEAAPTSQAQSFAELVTDAAAGKVTTLLMLGTNPAYTAPADSDFAAALAKVGMSVYLGDYADETAALSRWHIPATHEYEAWSDTRAFDGTVTIQQPQVRPFYDGRSAHEVLALFLGDTAPDGYEILRTRWRAYAKGKGETDFETFWGRALRAGIVPDTEAAAATVTPRAGFAAALPPLAAPAPPETLNVLFRPDPGLWDGRFAGLGWLQEMPRPFTRLTWDNAAVIAPALSERLGLAESDIVEIAVEGRRLRAPVFILPGQAPDCVTLALGYGRTRAGPVGSDVGADAYRLRLVKAPWVAGGATLARTGERYTFAAEQHHGTIEGRHLVRQGTLVDFLKNPQFLEHKTKEESLYPAFPYNGIAWAMSINLDSCVGCQACVVACQAENNIPVVGKEEVSRGRVMHWLRIDRYYLGGDLDEPGFAFQPVPCMHCENAPCEVVCPVHATVHDAQGLNVMVYNRCVGTRFCSNNCPYKVRRFNFFAYGDQDPRPRESWNPEVSVRGRGVMEKCTYCIQRTRQGQITAGREDRSLRDGEVVTACQQVCPTQAIVFGDRNDRASAVAKRKASPLDYVLLEELNTRPRTSYEAIIRNPNPAFEEGKG